LELDTNEKEFAEVEKSTMNSRASEIGRICLGSIDLETIATKCRTYESGNIKDATMAGRSSLEGQSVS
jgi:hypothetical protein